METPSKLFATCTKLLMLSVLLLSTFIGKSQPPTDPFTIYNTSTTCSITVAIEYWASPCASSADLCYNSPAGGVIIGPSGSFNVPGCGAGTPIDIHVVLLEIDGIPVTSSPNDVGWMGLPPDCINSSAASVSGPYPVGAGCGGTWTLDYNGPADVTFW